jgi:hypothetical protein
MGIRIDCLLRKQLVDHVLGLRVGVHRFMEVGRKRLRGDEAERDGRERVDKQSSLSVHLLLLALLLPFQSPDRKAGVANAFLNPGTV